MNCAASCARTVQADDNVQPARIPAREDASPPVARGDRASVHLGAALREVAGAAGWDETGTPPAAQMLPGTGWGGWLAPDGTTRLDVAEPDAESCPEPDQRCAAVVLTGGHATGGTWAVTGHCPGEVLPDLITAASFPPGDGDTDPPRLLPAGMYFREFSTGHPPGQCYEERWIDWGWGTEAAPLLAELVYFLPGSASRPGTPAGWHLVTAGPNAATLHADLKTPRHIVAALVAAMARRSYEN